MRKKKEFFADIPTQFNGIMTKEYVAWRKIINTKKPVLGEFKKLSGFVYWLKKQNAPNGYCLNASILSGEDVVYSPETCAMIPQAIQNQFAGEKSKAGLPRGVTVLQENKNGSILYRARITKKGKQHMIGLFHSVEDAVSAYKLEKDKYLSELAEEHKHAISAQIYDALKNPR